MILSYRHEFIFVKTKKTAGSSIEHYLFPYLGPDDICSGSALDGTPSLNPVTKKKGHMGWKLIAEEFPWEWRKFFSFAVVRNPWDVAVSAYFWFRHHTESVGGNLDKFDSFDHWVRHTDLGSLDPWPMIAHGDRPMVDAVIRYESLHQDLALAPVPYAGEMLTTFKKSGHRDGQNYRRFFQDDTRDQVRNIFHNMIEYFGYEF